MVGGVFRTTNGGVNWQQQLNLGSQNPSRIYMYNRNIGFISDNSGTYLRKTTNSGASWFVISGQNGFTDIYFADSLTGWKASGTMKKTTDSGLNWIAQTLPSGGNFITSQITRFSNISRDTIWGVGGYVFYPSTGNRGVLYRTTNGGTNWLYQIPDTGTITINVYFFVEFINSKIGWAYHPFSGIHTITGGDTTFLVGIKQVSTEVPRQFKLFQNYPNPFNPRTVIPYSLKSPGYIKLIAYDITGREIQRMVDGYYKAGDYEVDFMGKFTSSGVYFYRMQALDDRKNELYVETKKMILLK